MKLICFFILFHFYFFFAAFGQNSTPNSWKKVLEQKNGNITIAWTSLYPFLYKTPKGDMEGIEYELMKSAIAFLEKKYNVKININWVEEPDFIPAYNYAKKDGKSGYFTAAALSITNERKKEVEFTPPYMPDVTIIVSSSDVPLCVTEEEFVKNFKDLTAITVKGTTFEKDLLNLKKTYLPDLKIEYIPNTEGIIDHILTGKKMFGYNDLPLYLIAADKNLKIQRQPLFKMQREGYGIAMPLETDWNEPLKKFFKSQDFRNIVNSSIRKYLGKEISELISNTSLTGTDVALYNREKELKDKQLLENEVAAQKKDIFIYSLVIGLSFILILASFIFYRYYLKMKANRLLLLKNEEINQQKAEIEAQRDDIQQKTQNLLQVMEEIHIQKSQLEEMNTTKDKFFSIVAHDLRSPINSLSGFTSLLANYADSMTQEEIKKIAGDLNKSIENVLQLIEDLLTWARSQMNSIQVNPEDIDLIDIIREDIELSIPLAQKKGISLLKEIEKPYKVFADPNHVNFIVRNLLTNALKFTGKGGKIVISAKENGKFIELSVSDTGVGIAEETKERMFRMDAVQSTKGTDDEKGTGLGLILCKEFVRKNGGDIWVNSHEGQGSIFTFSLKKSLNTV
jgi:signal transduction histidine kinase